MRKTALPIAALLVWTALSTHAAPAPTTLQAAFEAAGSLGGYDRYLVLQTGQVYTGGLLIGPTWDEDRTMFVDDEMGLDVMIEGNGAILDLQGQQICISYCGNRLDLVDCIILNGGVRYRGELDQAVVRIPEGSVTYCTFFEPHDYAVRLDGAGAGVLCERNIVVSAVDTGPDGQVWNGITSDNLPTGLAFGISVQVGTYGTPDINDNWTWFRETSINAELLRHYCLLCEYG